MPIPDYVSTGLTTQPNFCLSPTIGASRTKLLSHIYTNKHNTHGITRFALEDKQVLHTLEAQLEYSLRAHKCGLGILAIGALVTRESDPNSTPPLNRVDETTATRGKAKKKEENIKYCAISGNNKKI